MNEYYGTIPQSGGYHDHDVKPTFKVGDYIIIGEDNQYDRIAEKLSKFLVFCYVENPIVPVPSSHKKITVVNIEERWRPKKGLGINSWLTHGDYSKNPSFEKFLEVECDEENLFYELADFLEYSK